MLVNTFLYTKTIIKGQELIDAMHNQFRVVSCSDYTDKNGKLPDGKRLTLQVMYDDTDYGVDKKTGKPRDNNVYQTFDVTVLNRNTDFEKGDIVALYDFDEEHSYAFDFNLILRFRDCKKIQSKVSAKTVKTGQSVPTGKAQVGVTNV
ncbi:MAG: hypothetical protein IJ535_10825 [Pseudobutyrivibrio sp.]|uniref:hypothetical protein n=1 Tax=Pseudobutyrivibrio sp. TaxID=2014367 RepID=UPI0025F7F3AB|nr:hypothetical protein [Pseudobutyrivibrio sp.]MBQ8490261.1 hypothetical protein [Pseudobutyrivibrio sp.]